METPMPLERVRSTLEDVVDYQRSLLVGAVNRALENLRFDLEDKPERNISVRALTSHIEVSFYLDMETSQAVADRVASDFERAGYYNAVINGVGYKGKTYVSLSLPAQK